MREFSMGRALSEGLAFISRAPAAHAIILILIGAVLPFVLQFALMGGPAGLLNPAMMGQEAAAMLAMGGATLLAAMAIGYVLQTGSYFGSLRIGLAREESLGGAIAYGLLAGLVVVVGLILAFAVIGIGLSQAIGGLASVLLLIVFLPAMAALYTVMVSSIAIPMFLAIVLLMVFRMSLMGPAMGAQNFGAGAVGFVVIVLIMLLLLWLAARFCCTLPAMAHGKTVNPIAGLGESWRLTAGHNGRLMLYLAAVGAVLGLVFLAYMSAIGVSFASSVGSGGMPQVGIGFIAVSILFGIAFAYVTVLVPAGIYRALHDDVDESAAVFA